MARNSNTKILKDRTKRSQGIPCEQGCTRTVSCHQRRSNRSAGRPENLCRGCAERHVSVEV